MGQFHSDFDSNIITGNRYTNKDNNSIIINFTTKEEKEEWLKNNKDFKTDPEIYATESIFLGKKCYIDKLEGKDFKGNNAVDYHIRMKGISNKSILYKSIQEDKPLLEIYKNLLNGDREEFDLACGGKKCCFVFNNDYTIKSKYEFLRKVKF